MRDVTPEFFALGMIWYIVFLFSTTCHEAAHALAAKLGGDPTAFRGGQVTLNPLPHIQREPFGMVLIPILTYFWMSRGSMIGWASAPYDPDWERRYPRRAAWMALAGPGANFTLMLLAAAAIRAGVASGVFQAPQVANFTRITEAANPGMAGSVMTFAATFLSVLFLLNLLLGTFNLLPVPPLDGSSGVTLLMSEGTARRFHELLQEPMFRMVGLLAAWWGFGRVFDMIFTFALNALYPGANYH
ncbi:MAG: site-2 protease family protein [Acidobacteria bacterium]|nr:site-2 protease family protein [Acidobacteriota bacterium]